MSEKIYSSLWEACCDMRKCSQTHKSQIVSADDAKRLLLGWVCDATGQGFYLRLTQIKTRQALQVPFDNPELEKLITRLITTATGRQQLADFLSWNSDNSELSSALDIFERALKLKAFW